MKLWGTKSCQSKISEYLQSVKKLGLDVGAICADITKKLPISDNSFDIVWHAGVIEHFSDAENLIKGITRMATPQMRTPWWGRMISGGIPVRKWRRKVRSHFAQRCT